MPAAESLWAFVPAALLVIITPGPAMLLVLGALARSRRHALAAVLGLAAGDALLITLAGLGLASLVLRWPLLLTALRWLGAVYIGWMGLRTLWDSRLPHAAHTATASPPARRRGGFQAALLLTLINPKPVLFFAAFLPLFLRPDSPQWLAGFFCLGALFELLNLGWYALLIGLLGTLGPLRPGGAWLQRGAGAALLVCALAVLCA